MRSSRKAGLVVLLVLAMGIFGYSQYASASQIEISIAQSELLDKTDAGSSYGVELQVRNPSLLVLTAGETEFFVVSDDEMVGRGELEPFTLQPLDSSYVSGTFHTEPDASDEPGSVKITGIIRYDMVLASIDVPFVYYPTEEQAREFIHQS